MQIIKNKIAATCTSGITGPEVSKKITGLFQTDEIFPLGKYPHETDTIRSFNEAMVKNIAVYYLMQKLVVVQDTTGYKNTDLNILRKLYDRPDIQEMQYDGNLLPAGFYSAIIDDRMEFLKFFLIDKEYNDIFKDEIFKDFDADSGSAPRILPFRVYPNPVVGFATVEWHAALAAKYSMEIFDLHGVKVKTLFSGKIFSEGVQRTQFNLKGAPAGIYFLNLSGGNKDYSYKYKFIYAGD